MRPQPRSSTVNVSKQTGKKLVFSWEDYLAKGKASEFFNFHRETYNFFKHADRDFDKELSVPDLAPINIAFLFVCAENYRKLFEEDTDHMLLISGFMQVIAPNIFDLPNPEAHEEHMATLANSTPEDFFTEAFKPNRRFPDIQVEITVDLADNGTLYQTPVLELREHGLNHKPGLP